MPRTMPAERLEKLRLAAQHVLPHEYCASSRQMLKESLAELDAEVAAHEETEAWKRKAETTLVKSNEVSKALAEALKDIRHIAHQSGMRPVEFAKTLAAIDAALALYAAQHALPPAANPSSRNSPVSGERQS